MAPLRATGEDVKTNSEARMRGCQSEIDETIGGEGEDGGRPKSVTLPKGGRENALGRR